MSGNFSKRAGKRELIFSAGRGQRLQKRIKFSKVPGKKKKKKSSKKCVCYVLVIEWIEWEMNGKKIGRFFCEGSVFR